MKSDLTIEQQIRQKYKELITKRLTPGDWYRFIEGKDIVMVSDICLKVLKARKVLEQRKLKIRKYCNLQDGPDIFPYEVVKVISPKKVEIRAMDFVLTKEPEKFVSDGFLGYYEDAHEQRWHIFGNGNNRVETIQLTDEGWGKGRYSMSDKPVKFHDYNF